MVNQSNWNRVQKAGRDAVKVAVTTPKKSNATSLEASNSETYKGVFGKGKLGLVLEEGTYSTGQTYVKVVSVEGQAKANGVQINSAIIRVGAQDFLQNPTVNEVTEALIKATKPMEVVFKRPIQETGISKEDVAQSTSPAKVDSTKSPKNVSALDKVDTPKAKKVDSPQKLSVPQQQKATPQKTEKATPQKAAGKPEEKAFNFDKGSSLGLVLSEVHSADGKTDIVQVVEIAPGSQAAGFSNLLVNDQIIRVGQTNVMGMDFEHVMDTIKKQKTTETNSPLELVFISPQHKSHQTIKSASLPQQQKATPQKSEKATPQKAAGKPEEKAFNFDKGSSLGLVLSEVHSADGKTDIVQVVEIAPGSQAAGFSNLLVNDQIIRVGQTNVMGMDFEHVMDTIKKQKTTETNSPLELVFISPQQSSQKKSVSRALATPATGDSKSKPSPSTTSSSSSKKKAGGAKKKAGGRKRVLLQVEPGVPLQVAKRTECLAQEKNT